MLNNTFLHDAITESQIAREEAFLETLRRALRIHENLANDFYTSARLSKWQQDYITEKLHLCRENRNEIKRIQARIKTSERRIEWLKAGSPASGSIM